MSTGTALAQQATITLLDENGQTIPFAAIEDEEGRVIVYADVNGVAEFNVDCGQRYLVVYFGYEQIPLVLSCKEDRNIVVNMVPEVISLKTINIIGRAATAQSESPYQVAQIEKQLLKRFQSQTTTESLEQNGGAFIQRSQMGGGSPILRGFEANKVLLVVDGIRMNNAIYRSGHLQNAISIDQAILDNITTLYGPGSILFGSDALGGVIHFQSARPKFGSGSKANISGGYYARYATANQERSAHAHINLGGQKIASLTSVTHSTYADLRAGKNYSEDYPDFGKRFIYVDPNTDEIIENNHVEKQVFTGYDQTDLLQKITYRIDRNKFLGLNVQYSFTSDVPRYDELSIVDEAGQPAWSEWYYGPQNRFLAALRYDSQVSTRIFDRLQAQFAFQRILEDRHNRAFRSPDLISNFEEVDVYSGTLDFIKALSDEQELSYGLEYRFNQVRSTAMRLNKETMATSSDVFTRYPSGDSEMFDAGLYALYQLKKEKYTVQLGSRFNWNKLDVLYSRDDFFQWPSFFYNGLAQENSSLTWLAGINYSISDRTQLRAFSGSAFRAPNVDDFAKVRVKAARDISIPNTKLASEKTWNVELGLQHTFESTNQSFPKINAGITSYYTFLRDAIIRSDFALTNGDSTFNFDGNELIVQANVNADEGYILGVSFETQAQISSALSARGAVSWQRGRSTRSNVEQPLAHIPPLYGQFTLDYTQPKWSVSFKTIFNGRKKLEDFAPASSDNEEFATPEGSLAWATLNLYGSFSILDNLTVRGGIENMLDLHYRTFSSGLSAPGRNIKIGIYGSF